MEAESGGRLLYACLYIVWICMCMHVCINTHLYTLTHVLWIGNHLHGSNIKSSFLPKETKHWKHQRKTEPHQSGQGGRAYLCFSTWKYKKENLPSQAEGKVALSTTNHMFPTKKRKKKNVLASNAIPRISSFSLVTIFVKQIHYLQFSPNITP